MKCKPRFLRFDRPVWTPSRGQLIFLGKGNTLHLQETALVVEGNLLCFRLPVVDRFIQRAFSRWSMVTVPYSQITYHVYRTYRIAKGIYWGLAGLAFALAYVLMSRSEAFAGDRSGALDLLFLLALWLLLIGAWVHLRTFRSRHLLWFLNKDDDQRLLCFRFLSRDLRQRFMEVLEANRKTARSLPSPAPPSGEKPSRARAPQRGSMDGGPSGRR
jgi:hypothetical protein